MKQFILRWEWMIGFVAVAVAEVLATVLHGWRGLAGMTLGISATWFNSWAWWGIAGALGDSARGGGSTKKTRAGTIVVVLAFLLKLPILLGLGLLTGKIGGAALPCFVAGLGMVYFGLVGWACTHA